MRSWQLPLRHLHVVFTVPHELCPLILANRGPLFSLLIRSAGQTLLTLGAQQLSAELGAVVTPHSWGQLALPHPHGHCIATPGGLSLCGTRWVDASQHFLQPHDLARRFRRLYLRGILRLYRRGELTLPDSRCGITSRQQLRLWLAPLARKRWVVDCQPPPLDCQDSEAVLKYLARYVAGTAIHDGRMVSDDGQQVTFTAKNYPDGTRGDETITGEELVRRFCYHIFPKGFHRSRSYGLFAARKRNEKLALCRRLLGVAESDDKEEAALQEPQPGGELREEKEEVQTRKRCPRCLLWTMFWVGRFTVAQIYWRERRQTRLGELLLSVVTTLDIDRPQRLLDFQQQQNELCALPDW